MTKAEAKSVALVEIICAQCGATDMKERGAVNRARGRNAKIYCGKSCAGIAHRVYCSSEERKAKKAAYDVEYRAKNLAAIKAKKSDYFRRTYDPDAARVERKKNMARHIEYCRRPEYRQWKSAYDKRYLAKKEFGEFAESALLLREIENEVLSRATRYEIYQQNGTLNKALMRRRAL